MTKNIQTTMLSPDDAVTDCLMCDMRESRDVPDVSRHHTASVHVPAKIFR